MQAIRSDPEKTLVARGPSTYGIHWPKKGREVVWSSRRGNHLGQRDKESAAKGRTYGCKRSDQTLKKLLWHGGRPHMGSIGRRKVVRLFGARVAETILASGPKRPRQQAGHMDASDPIRP